MNIEPAKTAVASGKLVPNPKARLREQFHEVARFKYPARRTEETYWQWVVRYLRFHRQKNLTSLQTGHPHTPAPWREEGENSGRPFDR